MGNAVAGSGAGYSDRQRCWKRRLEPRHQSDDGSDRALFVLSGFFRGFDMKMIESFHLTVPNWLDDLSTTRSAANNRTSSWNRIKGFGSPTGRSRSSLACSPPAYLPGRMYYLYGIGAFNEVAFVAMLKAGMDTGVYGAVAALAQASCSPALSKVRWWGFWTSAGRSRPAWAWAFPALLLGAGIMFPVDQLHCLAGHRLVIGLAIGYVIILARKFTINQSNSTYGADVMMGAGNASAASSDR